MRRTERRRGPLTIVRTADGERRAVLRVGGLLVIVAPRSVTMLLPWRSLNVHVGWW